VSRRQLRREARIDAGMIEPPASADRECRTAASPVATVRARRDGWFV